MTKEKEAQAFVENLAEDLLRQGLFTSDTKKKDLHHLFNSSVEKLEEENPSLISFIRKNYDVYSKMFVKFARNRLTNSANLKSALAGGQKEELLELPYNLYASKKIKKKEIKAKYSDPHIIYTAYLLERIANLEESSDVLKLLKRCHKSSAPLSWVEDVRKLCTIANVRTESRVLQLTMEIFSTKLSEELEREDKDENSLSVVKSVVEDFVTFCSRKREDFQDFAKKPKYNDLLAAIVSMCIDAILLLFRKKSESERAKEGKRLCGWVSYVFFDCPAFLLDVLIQVSNAEANDGSMLMPLCKKAFAKPVGKFDMLFYSKYIVAVRQCYRHFPETMSDIIADARNIDAPEGYLEWLRKRNINTKKELPKKKHFKDIGITKFLLCKASDELISLLLDVLTDSSEAAVPVQPTRDQEEAMEVEPDEDVEKQDEEQDEEESSVQLCGDRNLEVEDNEESAVVFRIDRGVAQTIEDSDSDAEDADMEVDEPEEEVEEKEEEQEAEKREKEEENEEKSDEDQEVEKQEEQDKESEEEHEAEKQEEENVETTNEEKSDEDREVEKQEEEEQQKNRESEEHEAEKQEEEKESEEEQEVEETGSEDSVEIIETKNNLDTNTRKVAEESESSSDILEILEIPCVTRSKQVQDEITKTVIQDDVEKSPLIEKSVGKEVEGLNKSLDKNKSESVGSSKKQSSGRNLSLISDESADEERNEELIKKVLDCIENDYCSDTDMFADNTSPSRKSMEKEKSSGTEIKDKDADLSVVEFTGSSAGPDLRGTPSPMQASRKLRTKKSTENDSSEQDVVDQKESPNKNGFTVLKSEEKKTRSNPTEQERSDERVEIAPRPSIRFPKSWAIGRKVKDSEDSNVTPVDNKAAATHKSRSNVVPNTGQNTSASFRSPETRTRSSPASKQSRQRKSSLSPAQENVQTPTALETTVIADSIERPATSKKPKSPVSLIPLPDLKKFLTSPERNDVYEFKSDVENTPQSLPSSCHTRRTESCSPVIPLRTAGDENGNKKPANSKLSGIFPAVETYSRIRRGGSVKRLLSTSETKKQTVASEVDKVEVKDADDQPPKSSQSTAEADKVESEEPDGASNIRRSMRLQKKQTTLNDCNADEPPRPAVGSRKRKASPSSETPKKLKT